MKVTGEQGIGKILKIFLQVCFYFGLIILAILPFLLNSLGFNLVGCTCVCYPNGIVLLIITHKFIKLFDSLRLDTPFCKENVKLLKSTALVSLVGAILWIVDFFSYVFCIKSKDIILNSTLMFLAILFLGVAIALYILSELFNQATEYKTENDLTI